MPRGADAVIRVEDTRTLADGRVEFGSNADKPGGKPVKPGNDIRVRGEAMCDGQVVLAAGTDARWMSDVCPCTLRFAPIDINMQQFNSVHSVDENIDLSAIGAAIEFYKEVLRNYK